MFKIYDLNYQEVGLPVDALGFGMNTPENIGLDVEIGPIIYENIYTQSNRTDKLVKRYPKTRDVNLVITVISYKENPSDWRLKRDKVYEFFRILDVFYIAEEKQPYKILKVIVDENYEYERINENWARSEIPLKVIDTPFKQSLHSTADLDREGVRWNDKWAYGMGLSSAREQWKYSFEPTTTLISTPSSIFKDGGFTISNGLPNESNVNNIFSDYIKVDKNTLYRFEETMKNSNINFWRIFEYEDGNFIGYIAGDNGSNFVEFITRGNQIRVSTSVLPNMPVRSTNVGVTLNPRLSRYNIVHKFNFYNAGTEEVKLIQQKESEIKIDIKSSANWFEINDGETTFRLNKAVSNGDVLRIKGHTVTLNGNNVLGDTNGEFLTAKKGRNDWEVRGITNYDFSIDFRFLYD